MTANLTISKNPVLDPSEDYAFLTGQGLEHIQKLGSRLWTDYNIHDPGITILELLCYALSDLGYRAGFGMADLLAAPPGKVTDYARQGFHTAREILPMNPLTIRDFRKLLIDIDGIKNGWLHVKEDACGDALIYAECVKQVLQYFPATDHPVIIKGLYDVLVEFEDVDRMGNLNSGKVFYNFGFVAGPPDTTSPPAGPSTALIELRLPSWQELEAGGGDYLDFRRATSALIPAGGPDKPVEVRFISGNKNDNKDVKEADRAAALRGVVYASLTIRYLADKADPASARILKLDDVPMRVWFNGDAFRKGVTLDAIKAAIRDSSPAGLVGRYLALIHKADEVMAKARGALQAGRNLGEDWCGIKAVAVQDVSVCADIELDPAVDIEAVMAEAFYRIDQYFSPDIRFLSLKELMDRGARVEDIFEGPKLANGFLDDAQVDSTNLRTVLHTSDIMNLLMDIPGVKSIRNFTMLGYDREGRPQGPAQPWELEVAFLRFYPQASKFLLFKNGLPFLPDRSELNDVLQVVRGQNAQPKFPKTELDLPIPIGTHYRLEDYHPIQYQLPLTYGVGYEGLPSDASPERVAQARQLKAYLLFFEQMLVDYLAQLSNLDKLFAIDAGVKKTYFTRFLANADIRLIEDELYVQPPDPTLAEPKFDADKLEALAESPGERLDRRNRFLDHLLSRFAESFADYAVMLYRKSRDNGGTKGDLQEKLRVKKIDFLKEVPRMSRDRAKAINYKPPVPAPVPDTGSASGLALRIKLVLGLEAPDDEVFVVEHVLLRPRGDLDALLPICIPPGCEACGEEDPYSFRITVVLSGEGGEVNSGIEWRRFAETAIRKEVPAHLAAKICWVGKEQLDGFRAAWTAWLAEMAKDPPGDAERRGALAALIGAFTGLKSVYPSATLHDCIDGNDENPVFLDQTVITSTPKEKE